MSFRKAFLFFVLGWFSLFLWAQEDVIVLPDLVTYIDSPVVEQRQVLLAEDIEQLHVEDLPALMVAAGIQILSYGPYGLEQKPSIRGFTDETVRVIIDGVCVNNAQYGTFDFSTINIDDIERIEIVRGGFTEGVSDEGAVGGAIYITTKKQVLGHHFDFNSEIKSFFNFYCPVDTFSQSIGYKGQFSDFDFFKANVKGTFANNKFIYVNFKELTQQRENSDVIDGNANVNFQHYFNNGNYIAVNELFYAGKKQIPGPENNANIGLQKDFDNNVNVQLVLPQVARGLKVENSLSWLSNSRFYGDEGGSSEHFVNTIKYGGSAYYFDVDWFNETAGFTLDYTHLDSTDDGIHDQFSGAFKSTSKFFVKLGQNNEDLGFVFTIPLAVKFCNSNFAFTPKLGMGFESTFVNLYLDAYRMTQFPNMDDLYWDGDGFKGNPDLRPEDGFGGDFTLNVHNVWLPFSVSVFSNYYKEKIQWSNAEGSWRPLNIASAFYLGVDFSFEKMFWRDRAFVKGNGEYLNTRLLGENSKTYGKKIMWTPDFVGSLSGGCNIPVVMHSKGTLAESVTLREWGFVVDANYVGKRFTDNANLYYLEPYVLLNASMHLKFASGAGDLSSSGVGSKLSGWVCMPYLRIDNILNWSYESVEKYPMPGISGSLGIKITK